MLVHGDRISGAPCLPTPPHTHTRPAPPPHAPALPPPPAGQVVRDGRTKKSKGFGFVSFLDAADFAKALREMNGKYIGNRPCKLTKSSWDERTIKKIGPPAKKQRQ